MSFIKNLRKFNILCCHSNDSFYVNPNDPIIRCKKCSFTLSVHDLILKKIGNYNSIDFANNYSQWSGQNDDIPCILEEATEYMNKRILPTSITTSLQIVRTGSELLKAIHSPFIAKKNDPALFSTLKIGFHSIVNKVISNFPEKKTIVDSIVEMMLISIYNTFKEQNLHHLYFEILVPYVKFVSENYETFYHGDSWKLRQNLIEDLYLSHDLHENVSKFCIDFEAFHVMVLCYLYQDDLNLVYNLLLHFCAKICCGHFLFPDYRKFKVGQKLQKYLNSQKHYTILQKFQNGEVSSNSSRLLDCKETNQEEEEENKINKELIYDFANYFDYEFFESYKALELDIRKNVISPNENFIFEQIFPHILFEKRKDDLYAFLITLKYYYNSFKFTKDPETMISECKKVFQTTKKCITKVKNFNDIILMAHEQWKKSGIENCSIEHDIYWTKEFCELCLENDEAFKKELTEVISMFNVKI